jgi:hypothetical protein
VDEFKRAKEIKVHCSVPSFFHPATNTISCVGSRSGCP